VKNTWKKFLAATIIVAIGLAGYFVVSWNEPPSGTQGTRPAAGTEGPGPSGPASSVVPSDHRTHERSAGTASPAGSRASDAGPAAVQAAASPRPPLPQPSETDRLHREALSHPSDPERWVSLAKAYDAEGRSDLALAALKRALHLGVDFEGRREVQRLVREYEDYLRKTGGTVPTGDRRAPKKPHANPRANRTRVR